MKRKLCFIVAMFLVFAQTVFAINGYYDFKSKSNVSAEALSNALFYNLKDLAPVFVECEQQYGVNAIVLASLAAFESDWGRSGLAVSNNNLYGWRLGSGNWASFSSKSECIHHVAQFLNENYLSTDGKYYGGATTLDAVGVKYCDGNVWADRLNQICYQIESRCNQYTAENSTETETNTSQEELNNLKPFLGYIYFNKDVVDFKDGYYPLRFMVFIDN